MNNKRQHFKAKDHLVSGQSFTIQWDAKQGFAKTVFPLGLNLDQYYPKDQYTSHQTKREGITGFLYSLVQGIMFTYKRKLIQKYSLGITLLDVGGGIGEFANNLSKYGFNTSVVEPNPTAKQSCTSKGINSYLSVEDIPNGIQYSTISLWHALEHIPDLESTLQKLHKLLNSNGLLVVAVPNFHSYDATYYAEHWAALDVPRHLWHFTPMGLKQLLETFGFTQVVQKPLWFDAFYISYLSEKYQGNSFPLIRGLGIGLLSNFAAFSTKDYSSNIFIFKKKS